MEKVNKMKELLSNVFSIKLWFILFPFAILGLLFSGLFFIISCIYMLFDFIKNELNSLLKLSQNESSGVQVVKHLFGFAYVVVFNLLKTCVATVMAILYAFACIAFYVSSCGIAKNNPFGFHTI